MGWSTHKAVDSFEYLGMRIFCPPDSELYFRVRDSGVYEPENTRLICDLVRPNTYYFDIGANIGLTSIPVLKEVPTSTVVSMEPSPTTLGYLRKTVEASGFNGRWKIIGKGASKEVGQMEFFQAAPDRGAYDGFRDTGRGGAKRKIMVEVTTVDTEWHALGKPPVSFLKIDVEGAELAVLRGAAECLQSQRPYALVEWTKLNLPAYGCEPAALLEFASRVGYTVFSLPYLVPIHDAHVLEVQMIKTYDFLLAPRPGWAA
jgi:FkbM family methyltransferase